MEEFKAELLDIGQGGSPIPALEGEYEFNAFDELSVHAAVKGIADRLQSFSEAARRFLNCSGEANQRRGGQQRRRRLRRRCEQRLEKLRGHSIDEARQFVKSVTLDELALFEEYLGLERKIGRSSRRRRRLAWVLWLAG